MLQPGDIIAGRYRLTAHLGDGGSAGVWKAEDSTLEREVAIKFLYVQDERFREEHEEQFLREARLACAVKHRNVIQTMDFGRTEDGQAYMVMELLEGHDLGERMGRAPPLPIEQGINIVAQVLRGLAAVHESGIIHRDLKPENVLVTPALEPKVLDFGLALSASEPERPDVLFAGTPAYASPEQAQGEPLTPASDHLEYAGVGATDLWCTDKPCFGVNGTDFNDKLFTDQAIRLIEAHDKAVPFFMYIAFQVNHAPLQVPPGYMERYPEGQ